MADLPKASLSLVAVCLVADAPVLVIVHTLCLKPASETTVMYTWQLH